MGLRVDLNQQLKFPPWITTATLQPNFILRSNSAQTVIMAELEVLQEEMTEVAFEKKRRSTASLSRLAKKQDGRKAPILQISRVRRLHWKIRFFQ